MAKITTSRVTKYEMSDDEITQAIINYVAKKLGLTDESAISAIVTIRSDTSWEAEGLDLYIASVTITDTELNQ